MNHYLWCTQCDIIKPKIESIISTPKDHVWICRNCGSEVFEVTVPEGTSLLEFPLELLKLMVVYEDDKNRNDTIGTLRRYAAARSKDSANPIPSKSRRRQPVIKSTSRKSSNQTAHKKNK